MSMCFDALDNVVAYDPMPHCVTLFMDGPLSGCEIRSEALMLQRKWLSLAKSLDKAWIKQPASILGLRWLGA